MIRILTRYRTAAVVLALVVAVTAHAQPVLVGIGLSGSASTRDTLVIEGDTVRVLTQYFVSSGWRVTNTGFDLDSLGLVRLHFYVSAIPLGQPAMSIVAPATAFTVDTLNRRVSFNVRLTNVVNPYVRSLQLEMALFGLDEENHGGFSARRTSHLAVGGVPSLLNPVDALHTTYLSWIDLVTYPPVIHAPAASSTVPRRFDLHYEQPEEAYPRSVMLVIRNITPGSLEPPHTLRVRNLSAGPDNVLHLDAAALYDTTQFDSLSGSAVLTHQAMYQFVLMYQDINRNASASGALDSIWVERQTIPPQLFQPGLGSYTTDSTVRVIYELGEPPDSVWLIFEEDTLYAGDSASAIHDPRSPHILLLHPSLYGEGVVSFFLDGRDIGSRNPYVVESNRGADDRLVAQCIYKVTLSCGDTVGNDNASASNRGYIWPRDARTIPPRLLEPQPGVSFGQNLRVVFVIPEPARPGSVILRFTRSTGTPDPAIVHRLYLRTVNPGQTPLYLDCTQLHYSEMVDSVTGNGTPEQNNTLVSGARYAITITYQDSAGNPAATSTTFTAVFDNHTIPPVIATPQNGDTLDRAEVLVRYTMEEPAPPAALRLVLERTGGVEDLGSPHVLFLSNRDSGAVKELTLRPAALAASVGVDSVQGGPALIERAIYRLSITYRDTLLNPWTTAYVSDLVYPSGTIIYATGTGLGSGAAIPGFDREPAFRLSLRTENGESLLQGLRLRVDGDVQPADIVPSLVRLWASVDTILDAQDVMAARLTSWPGGDFVFSGFATPLSGFWTHFIVTLAFTPAADPVHRIRLLVTSPSSVNCGTDPVIAPAWPLGQADVALSVSISSFYTEQDTAFGALRVRWRAESERENAGFILLRRSENEASFVTAASYTSAPELVGRGTEPSGWDYVYVDRGLEPGRRYFYRLAAETYDMVYVELDHETEGTPRLPPADFVLGDPYPNPFNPTITIPFTVPYAARVEIHIYDVLGRKVRTLLRRLSPPADHRAQWDGRDDNGEIVPSGVYFCRMTAAGRFEQTRKLLLMR